MLKEEIAPVAEDKKADRKAFLLVTTVLLFSLGIQAITRQLEVARLGLGQPALEVWTLEATSHLVIFALLPIFPKGMTWAPIPGDRWWLTAVRHLSLAGLFSAAHICLMYVARLLLFPPLIGRGYEVNLLMPSHLVYEFQKDVLTYTIIAFTFFAFRTIEYRIAELRAALERAKNEHRLTLKSGGNTYFVQADQIKWAKAAANYVEVVTSERTYLTRMTLTNLERLLSESGNQHVRVHRSHIINRLHISEVKPNKDGSTEIKLIDGSVIPSGRRYRDRLSVD